MGVFYWTWRQWLSQPGRATMAVTVYAGVLALSMLFDGIRVGILEDLYNFPASLPADLIAVESGNTTFSLSPSKLPQLARSRAESVAGVVNAPPIMLLPFIFESRGESTPAMLIAYDELGGPENFREGRAPTTEREIVLDANLAKLRGVGLGATVTVWNYELTVVGLSVDSTSPFTPYAYITYDRLLDLLLDTDLPFGTGEFSLVSALLIQVENDENISTLREKLEAAMPDADIFTPDELGTADADFGNRLLGPVLLLISGIAWLIALLTMAMLRYADVQSNLRQFGIHKAIGADPIWLASTLTVGGLLICLPAFPLALVLAEVFAKITSEWNPLYGPRIFEVDVIARGAFVALLAASVGGLSSLRRLVRLEPVIVFQR